MMSKRVQLRRGTTAETNSFTGAVGEVTVDTDKKTVVVHDGVTAGGTPLARVSEVPSLVPQATETVRGGVRLATITEAAEGSSSSHAITPFSLTTGVYATLNALSTNPLVTPPPLYACRAWVNFNGTGTISVMSIRSSGNVSSITDNGTGNYTINFINPMPDSNYAVSYSASDTGDGQLAVSLSNLSVSSVGVSQKAVTGMSSYTPRDVQTATVAIFR